MTQTEAFDSYVKPYFSNFIKIVLTQSEIERIDKWAKSKAMTKKNLAKINPGDYCHEIDGEKEVKRNVTGQSGEVAVANYIKENFVDWSIGNSEKYNHPDICNEEVGIKTVEYGKLPIIHKNPKYPEVICIKKGNEVYICGLASVDVMKKYSDDNLIIDPNLRARGVKTGFFGFSELTPILLENEQ